MSRIVLSSVALAAQSMGVVCLTRPKWYQVGKGDCRSYKKNCLLSCSCLPVLCWCMWASNALQGLTKSQS